MYLGIYHRNNAYQRVTIGHDSEPDAQLFGIYIARDMASRGGSWTVTLYRDDGTPINRWHQNQPPQPAEEEDN